MIVLVLALVLLVAGPLSVFVWRVVRRRDPWPGLVYAPALAALTLDACVLPAEGVDTPPLFVLIATPFVALLAWAWGAATTIRPHGLVQWIGASSLGATGLVAAGMAAVTVWNQLTTGSIAVQVGLLALVPALVLIARRPGRGSPDAASGVGVATSAWLAVLLAASSELVLDRQSFLATGAHLVPLGPALASLALTTALWAALVLRDRPTRPALAVGLTAMACAVGIPGVYLGTLGMAPPAVRAAVRPLPRSALPRLQLVPPPAESLRDARWRPMQKQYPEQHPCVRLTPECLVLDGQPLPGAVDPSCTPSRLVVTDGATRWPDLLAGVPDDTDQLCITAVANGRLAGLPIQIAQAPRARAVRPGPNDTLEVDGVGTFPPTLDGLSALSEALESRGTFALRLDRRGELTVQQVMDLCGRIRASCLVDPLPGETCTATEGVRAWCDEERFPQAWRAPAVDSGHRVLQGAPRELAEHHDLQADRSLRIDANHDRLVIRKRTCDSCGPLTAQVWVVRPDALPAEARRALLADVGWPEPLPDLSTVDAWEAWLQTEAGRSAVVAATALDPVLAPSLP